MANQEMDKEFWKYIERYSNWHGQGHRQKYEKDLKFKKYDHIFTALNKLNDLSEGDLFETEAIVLATFTVRDTPSNIRQLALNKFYLIGVKRSTRFDAWIHSLSHFEDNLWKRRMTRWIGNFNQIAFSRARDEDNNIYLDSLVWSFVRHSKWFDDPKQYHLTTKNLKLLNYKRLPKDAKSRLSLSPFPSELDFYRWQFKYPELFVEYNSIHISIISYTEMNKVIKKIWKNNSEPKEFLQLEKKLLIRHTKLLAKIIHDTEERYDLEEYGRYLKRMGIALIQLSKFSPNSYNSHPYMERKGENEKS